MYLITVQHLLNVGTKWKTSFHMAFKVGQFDVVENGNNKTPFIFLAVSRSFASKLGYYLTVSSKPPKFPSAFPKDYDKSSAVRRRSSYPAV